MDKANELFLKSNQWTYVGNNKWFKSVCTTTDIAVLLEKNKIEEEKKNNIDETNEI